MRTLIMYSSRFGATAKCAALVAKRLGQGADAIAIEQIGTKDWRSYDAIVLGSSIHIGKIGKKLRQYIKRNEPELLQKRLGIFLCSGDQETDYWTPNFPETLRAQGVTRANFGGELDLTKVSGLLRFILKHKGVVNSYHRLDMGAIDRFTQEFVRMEPRK